MNKLELKNGTLTVSQSSDQNHVEICEAYKKYEQNIESSPMATISYTASFRFQNNNDAYATIISPILPLQTDCQKASKIMTDLLQKPEQEIFHLLISLDISKNPINSDSVYECFVKFNNIDDLPKHYEDIHSTFAIFEILSLDEAQKIHDKYWESIENPYQTQDFRKLSYLSNSSHKISSSETLQLLQNSETQDYNIEFTIL